MRCCSGISLNHEQFLTWVLFYSVLHDLALVQLVQKQLLPYLRAGAASVPVAVDRASRVMKEVTSVKGLTQGKLQELVSPE